MRSLSRLRPIAAAIGLASLFVVGGCSSGGGGGDGDEDDEGVVVGAAGGTVTSEDGRLTLTIPAGALDADESIIIERVSPTPAGAIAAYDLGPDGLQFDQPVTLTMTYDEGALPAGVSETDLLLRTLANTVWIATEASEDSSVDTVQNSVTAETTHFSVFGIVPLSSLSPPTASLSPSPSSGPLPLMTTFTAAASDPDGGIIVRYEWDFENDGTFDDTTTTPSSSHTYATGGSFTARVRVTDDEGQTAEATASLSAGTSDPTVSLAADPPSGPAPLQVIFTATSADPDGGSIVQHEWDLDGDGTFEESTGAANTATRTYDLPGTFTGLTVRVTDDEGQSAEATSTVTVTLPPIGEVLPLSAGNDFTCTSDGMIECWGRNVDGRLGNGTTTDTSTPTPVDGIASATTVSAGIFHGCAVLTGGTVSCWGDNAFGNLGDGTTAASLTPVAVTGIANAASVSAGLQFTCAVLLDGAVSCWGSNVGGQLGDGTLVGSSVPVAVSGIDTALSASTGFFHACALLADGTVRCWGSNFAGALGNGTDVSSNVPVPVSGIDTATALSESHLDHTCALLANGAVSCWGDNGHGQLGNGSTTNASVPVPVSGISTAAAVSAGFQHSCALLANGTVKCWGENESGQLGDGTNTDSDTPVDVADITDATAISAGIEHTCARLSDGSVRCWGIPLLLDADPPSGGVPRTVTLTAEIVDIDPEIAAIVEYEWDFDGNDTFDETTTSNTTTHVYGNVGEFMAKVRVTDDQGQTAEATTEVVAGNLTGDLTSSTHGLAQPPGSNPQSETNNEISVNVTAEIVDGIATIVDASGPVSLAQDFTENGCTRHFTYIGEVYAGEVLPGNFLGEYKLLRLNALGIATTTGERWSISNGNVICVPVGDSSEEIENLIFFYFTFVPTEDGTGILAMDFTLEIGTPLTVQTGRLE